MGPVLLLKTVVVFAALLGVLVFVHELGHFSVARLVGMKVHEFALGFGPIIARLFKRNGTEFNIRAVPLGGFVRIAGMEPGEEEVENGFNSKSGWAKAAVVLAGPIMSLVLGYVVLIMIGYVWGFSITTTNIETVAPNSPAAEAGLRKGDAILAINKHRLDNGYVFKNVIGKKNTGDGYLLRNIVNNSKNKKLTLLVYRDGKQLTITATPKLDKKTGRTLLGIGMTPVQKTHLGITGSTAWGTIETTRFLKDTITTIFSKRVAKEAGGIVMIGYLTSKTVEYGAQYVFFELALLSLTLGILNLVPWPVLDGGHLMFIAIEGIRRKKLKPETKYAIQLGGMAVLIGLAIFLVGFDVWRIAGDKLPGP